MKKVLTALAASASLMLAACNADVIDTHFAFTRAKINLFDKVVEVKVKSWNDYASDGDVTVVQIVTTNGDVYYTSVENVVLIED